MTIKVEQITKHFNSNEEIESVAKNAVVDNYLYFLTQSRHLAKVNLMDLTVQEFLSLENTNLNFNKPLIMKTSPTGRFCVVADEFAANGIVVDLEKNGIILEITRDDYSVQYCQFQVEFFKVNAEEFLIHGTAWNRLDITNLHTQKLITERISPNQDDPNELDYFHSGITVSPDYKWVIDNGWVWHPWGKLTAWSLDKWIENVWESEAGESKFEITSAAYLWDRPLCWINEDTIAYWGIGEDDEEMEDAVVIYDLAKREKIKVIKDVPKGNLYFDKYLFCNSTKKGLSIWDIYSGEMLFLDGNIKNRMFIKSDYGYITDFSKDKIELINASV